MNLRGLSRNVIVLGWVSFFTDLASEMLYPIIPLFLTGPLGKSAELLGVIEGVAEGGSSVLRWVAGAFSDRFQRRKPFVVWGYSISALSKPVMGLAAYVIGWPIFFVGRTTDRLGKSIRTSARDALIADSTEPAHRGFAFGFHRAMDTSGAVGGPLIALVILFLRPGFPMAWLFFIALGPGIISALLAGVAVKDIPHAPRSGPAPSIWQSYPAALWLLIAATGIFALGNSSDSFLILRSSQLLDGGRNWSIAGVILVYVVYNVVFAAGAAPLGKLSDTVGRKPIIIVGWLIFAAVYLGFASLHSRAAPWALFAIYGIYQAMTDGVSKALISDIVPQHQRAGAIGLFYTVTGVCQLGANLITGSLWNVRLVDGRVMAGLLPGVIGALVAILLLTPLRAPYEHPDQTRARA